MNLSALVNVVEQNVINQITGFEELEGDRPLVLASVDTVPCSGEIYVTTIEVALQLLEHPGADHVTFFASCEKNVHMPFVPTDVNIIAVKMDLINLCNSFTDIKSVLSCQSILPMKR
jgi:hypothetical protein